VALPANVQARLDAHLSRVCARRSVSICARLPYHSPASILRLFTVDLALKIRLCREVAACGPRRA